MPAKMAVFHRDFSADATGRGLENGRKSLAEQVKRRGAAVRQAGSWRSGRLWALQRNARLRWAGLHAFAAVPPRRCLNLPLRANECAWHHVAKPRGFCHRVPSGAAKGDAGAPVPRDWATLPYSEQPSYFVAKPHTRSSAPGRGTWQNAFAGTTTSLSETDELVCLRPRSTEEKKGLHRK